MSRTIASGMLVALFALPVSGATIRVGDHDLGSGRGPGNEIELEIIGDGVEIAAGIDLFLFLVDDPPPEVTPGPVFTGLTTDEPGLFFEGPGFAETVTIAPTNVTAQTMVSPERTVSSTPTVVALLTIDTTLVPAAGGTWQLTLGSTDLSGKANPADSGNTIVTVLEPGTITVGAVPEPAVLAQLLALVGMGGAGLFFRRRKQRAG